jgi:DNA-binding transcriptional MerR regulator
MTGLSAPNLRAWERRYGIPNPQRGDNAYRLYSNRDITILRKMKTLCDEGHAPSDAAKIALNSLNTKRIGSHIIVGLEEAKNELIDATKDFNPQEVERILNQAISLGNAWSIYQNVFEPALVAIGELWESDPRYVANEHMLSQAIKSSLAQMLKMLQPPKPRKKIIFACVRDEQHDIPIYALALRASHVGCQPIILGANTPPEALETAVSYIRPHGVILSTTTSMIVNMKPAGMGSYVASNNQGPNSINQDSISLSGFTVRELSQEELFVELNSYQNVCGHTPWLIGGQSLSSWPMLPDHLKMNISSSYDSFDALMG